MRRVAAKAGKTVFVIIPQRYQPGMHVRKASIAARGKKYVSPYPGRSFRIRKKTVLGVYGNV